MKKAKNRNIDDNGSEDNEPWVMDKYNKGNPKESDLSFENLLNESMDLEEKKALKNLINQFLHHK